MLYSSLITVALEVHPAPADISERVNDVRMGETSENRFADQTLGIVSYSDGESLWRCAGAGAGRCHPRALRYTIHGC